MLCTSYLWDHLPDSFHQPHPRLSSSDATSSLYISNQLFCRFTSPTVLPSVLWHRWLGVRKGIQPVKNCMVKCSHGYLSGARCKWFAYTPLVDATATPSSLSSLKSRMFWPLWCQLIQLNARVLSRECPGVRVLAWSWSRSLPSEGDLDSGYVGLLLDCTLSLVC